MNVFLDLLKSYDLIKKRKFRIRLSEEGEQDPRIPIATQDLAQVRGQDYKYGKPFVNPKYEVAIYFNANNQAVAAPFKNGMIINQGIVPADLGNPDFIALYGGVGGDLDTDQVTDTNSAPVVVDPDAIRLQGAIEKLINLVGEAKHWMSANPKGNGIGNKIMRGQRRVLKTKINPETGEVEEEKWVLDKDSASNQADYMETLSYIREALDKGEESVTNEELAKFINVDSDPKNCVIVIRNRNDTTQSMWSRNNKTFCEVKNDILKKRPNFPQGLPKAEIKEGGIPGYSGIVLEKITVGLIDLMAGYAGERGVERNPDALTSLRETLVEINEDIEKFMKAFSSYINEDIAVDGHTARMFEDMKKSGILPQDASDYTIKIVQQIKNMIKDEMGQRKPDIAIRSGGTISVGEKADICELYVGDGADKRAMQASAKLGVPNLAQGMTVAELRAEYGGDTDTERKLSKLKDTDVVFVNRISLKHYLSGNKLPKGGEQHPDRVDVILNDPSQLEGLRGLYGESKFDSLLNQAKPFSAKMNAASKAIDDLPFDASVDGVTTKPVEDQVKAFVDEVRTNSTYEALLSDTDVTKIESLTKGAKDGDKEAQNKLKNILKTAIHKKMIHQGLSDPKKLEETKAYIKASTLVTAGSNRDTAVIQRDLSTNPPRSLYKSQNEMCFGIIDGINQITEDNMSGGTIDVPGVGKFTLSRDRKGTRMEVYSLWDEGLTESSISTLIKQQIDILNKMLIEVN